MTAEVVLDRLPQQSRRGRFPVSATAWLLLAAVWFAVLVATGSPALDTARWVVACVLAVLLPGIALVRAVRPAQAPLIEDVAWGIPAGCLVALAGWVLDAGLPWSPPSWLWGPAVIAVLLAVPTARRRVLARPAPGWGVGPNLAVIGAIAVAIAWMAQDFLRLNPADPGAGGRAYYPDVLFQLAVVGQMRHSLVPQYPTVSGEPFAYHWFGHAILAHLATGSGVDPWDMVLRLAPVTLLPAIVLLAAVVARRLSGNVWAGPIAAALLTVMGNTAATFWTPDGRSQSVVQTYWWASLTTVFGWLATLACAGCAIAFLRKGADDDAVPVRLLIPLLVFGAGAKSADDAVLAGGAVFAVLVALRTKRRVRAALIVCAATVGILLIAKYTIYGGTGYGLQFAPGGTIQQLATWLFPGLTTPSTGSSYLSLPQLPMLALVAAFGLWLLPLLPRLVGIGYLTAARRDAASWFVLGTVVAGFGGALAFRQPGLSEEFFLVAAYPVGIVGSASGIATYLARRQDTPWRLASLVGLLFGLAATIAIATFAGRTPPMAAWLTSHGGAGPTPTVVDPVQQVMWWAGPLVVLAAVLGGCGALAILLTMRRTRLRRAVPVGLLAALLGTGMLSTGLYLTNTATTPSLAVVQGAGQPPNVTQDELAAGKWLAAHAGPHDVVGSNQQCLQPQAGPQPQNPCTAKAYTLSALSQRSVDVGGWAYAPRNLDSAWTATVWWPNQPFWDPERLTEETTSFTQPTPALLDRLYSSRGVRWLVADRNGTPADAKLLDSLAVRRLTLPTVTVWELRPSS
ncbi:hypothetical protein [Sinomonas humi]|nr:hypothetical protein [Sinomonas humi]